jgi:hypothetical protein
VYFPRVLFQLQVQVQEWVLVVQHLHLRFLRILLQMLPQFLSRQVISIELLPQLVVLLQVQL